jgi:hypothetical protein
MSNAELATASLLLKVTRKSTWQVLRGGARVIPSRYNCQKMIEDEIAELVLGSVSTCQHLALIVQRRRGDCGVGNSTSAINNHNFDPSTTFTTKPSLGKCTLTPTSAFS